MVWSTEWLVHHRHLKGNLNKWEDNFLLLFIPHLRRGVSFSGWKHWKISRKTVSQKCETEMKQKHLTLRGYTILNTTKVVEFKFFYLHSNLAVFIYVITYTLNFTNVFWKFDKSYKFIKKVCELGTDVKFTNGLFQFSLYNFERA